MLQNNHITTHMINSMQMMQVGISSMSKTRIQQIKIEIPDKLKEKSLIINKEKTEHYAINKNENSCKNCKYLGSFLDTDKRYHS